MSDVFSEVVEAAGSIKALADRLHESLATVCNWRSRGIPANRAKAVEAVTGISVRRIRSSDWQHYWPELGAVPVLGELEKDASLLRGSASGVDAATLPPVAAGQFATALVAQQEASNAA